MKKLLSSSTIIAIILMTTLTIATSAQSFTLKSENPAKLNYIGSINSHPRLLLSLNNNEADEFNVTITDQAGSTIYNESFSGKMVSRTYQLNSDEFDASEVNFHVYSKRNNNTVVYKVINNQRFVQDVVINKK